MEKNPSEEQMDEEFANFLAKSNDTYNEILKNLDERGGEKMSPPKTSSRDSVIGNSSSNDSLAPVFNPENSAKTSTQKPTRGRGSSTRGRGRGRGASNSTSVNETKTSSKSTGKSKMPSLFETLGTASKTARPQRAAKATDTSKSIYISDSD